MKIRVVAMLACLVAWTSCNTAHAEIKLVAQGAIPGDRSDLSGLKDLLEDGTPHNALGGMGSAIAYSGKGNRYILTPDRGPKDGTTKYRCRFQTMDIVLKGNQLVPTLVATTFLTDEAGNSLLGYSGALVSGKTSQPRLDPEGVRVGPKGTLFISDEYGPYVYAFDGNGKRLAILPVPARFQAQHPHADPKVELALNKTGRLPNKGMEGLAITPDGKKLLAMMQSPLIQDGGRDGRHVRILEIDLASRRTREFVYPLAGTGTAVSEIVAINDHQFLVLERDGEKAQFRKLFKIDLAKATDVSGVDVLPRTELPPAITPVSRELFLDFADPRFQLAGKTMPVKIEGLAFGPDFADGRHLLLVTSDNDFVRTESVRFFGFAIDPDDLPGYQPQSFGR